MFYTSDSFSDPEGFDLAKKFQIRFRTDPDPQTTVLPALVGSLCGDTPAVVHEFSRHLLRKKLAAAAPETVRAVCQPSHC
jgi:hypothetical protein